VEVKRDDSISEARTLVQALGYLCQAWQHPSRDEELRGYLVMDNLVTPLRINDAREPISDPPFDIFAAGELLTKELCEIAIRKWN
jgi:hypothetical protein